MERYSVYKLNLVLLFLMFLFAVSYIFLVNFLVAQKYTLDLYKNEFSSLTARAASQNTNQMGSDLQALLLFTQKSGMVEAKDTDSILQDRNLALTP